MTHEEIMTWLASREIRSYRDMPQVWYQIQTKLRDEARPKSGILRTREFAMKDSYSFDISEEALDKNYQLHAGAYHRIFKRCGLTFFMVESDPGMMGGGVSHEFMAPSPAGEDKVALCDKCGYSANTELALSNPVKTEAKAWEKEEIHTPEKRTVKEVSNFLKLTPEYFIKSILVISAIVWILALLMTGFAFSMIVNERQRELGLLRAMGARKGQIFSLIIAEALVISIAGGIVGITAGASFLYAFKDIIIHNLKLPYLIPPLPVLGELISGAVFFALITGLLASLLPAISASRREPYDAIRKGE